MAGKHQFTRKTPHAPMLGLRFGMLTVVEPAECGVRGQARFICRCDCGEEVTRYGADLRYAVGHGRSPNCGCVRGRRGPRTRVNSGLRKGLVTLATYRSVAKEFTPAQVGRLAEILARHPKTGCYFCATARRCQVVAEAVEMVLMEERYGLRGERDEPWQQTDFTRQGTYTR